MFNPGIREWDIKWSFHFGGINLGIHIDFSPEIVIYLPHLTVAIGRTDWFGWCEWHSLRRWGKNAYPEVEAAARAEAAREALEP